MRLIRLLFQSQQMIVQLLLLLLLLLLLIMKLVKIACREVVEAARRLRIEGGDGGRHSKRLANRRQEVLLARVGFWRGALLLLLLLLLLSMKRRRQRQRMLVLLCLMVLLMMRGEARRIGGRCTFGHTFLVVVAAVVVKVRWRTRGRHGRAGRENERGRHGQRHWRVRHTRLLVSCRRTKADRH